MDRFKKLVLDQFCIRQFEVSSTSHIDFDKEEFIDRVNALYNPDNLKNGYAPFCKHIFIPNFTKTLVSTVEITQQNENLIKTAYEARTEKELPVLRRFIPKDLVTTNQAKYLDIILYSKEQIQKENEAMKTVDVNQSVDYDYGIISVKPQDYDYEISMDPITMMRNSLGKEHGGSGVDMDFQKYKESVDFWSKNIIIK